MISFFSDLLLMLTATGDYRPFLLLLLLHHIINFPAVQRDAISRRRNRSAVS